MGVEIAPYSGLKFFIGKNILKINGLLGRQNNCLLRCYALRGESYRIEDQRGQQ
jgi:hypothetical protein